MTRAEAVKKREASMPRTFRKTYREAVSGKSRKSAIAAFCAECVGWQREEVRLCSALACPLYAYRPFVEKAQGTPVIGLSAA